MQYLAEQFVFADSIQQAVQRSVQEASYRYSFDMLGEAALTADDAERYYQSYLSAILKLAEEAHSPIFMPIPAFRLNYRPCVRVMSPCSTSVRSRN